MIIFPAGFTPTKYPGYYWNIREQALYSIKIGGVLKKIKLVQPSVWSGPWLNKPFYRVSHKGQTRYLIRSELQKLTLKHHEIPYA